MILRNLAGKILRIVKDNHTIWNFYKVIRGQDVRGPTVSKIIKQLVKRVHQFQLQLEEGIELDVHLAVKTCMIRMTHGLLVKIQS
jgi:hypothetical protein